MAFTLEELQELAKVAELAEANGELGGTFIGLPDGEYQGIIIDAGQVDSKGGKPMVKFIIQVNEGESDGVEHHVWWMLEGKDASSKQPLITMQNISRLAKELKLIPVEDSLSLYDFNVVLTGLINCYVTFTIKTSKNFTNTSIFANQ